MKPTTAALLLACASTWLPAQVSPSADVLQRAKELGTNDLGQVILKLREELERRLLAPAEQHLARATGDVGVARILRRGRFEGQTLVRGGGAYFSFRTRSNDYDREPDLELTRDSKFLTGFHGGMTGAVAAVEDGPPLGEITFDLVPEDLRGPPEDFRTLRLAPAPAAAVGQIHLVRTVYWEGLDVTTAIEVLAADPDGVTIAYRVLDQRPAPKR